MNSLFHIFQINTDDAARIASSAEEPHSHEYDELIIGVQGSLEHFIDFHTSLLSAPYVSFVTRGKTHLAKPLMPDGECHIWVIRFMEDFLPEMTYGLYTHFHGSANFELEADSYFQRMVTLCEIIGAEMAQHSPNLPLVRDLLKALLTMVKSEHDKISSEERMVINPQNTTFHNFLKILEENFRRDAGVEFYAEKLFMSSRNLNLVCQNAINKSVSEIIEERKMAEGKKLLTNTGKSVSEIGYEIGYNDKACFTKVFKKRTGKTPTAFRKQMQKLIS